MRIIYDSDVDAVTFVVSHAPAARTVDVGEGRFVDLDADGDVVAVEILDASSGFHLADLVARFDLAPLLSQLGESYRQAKRGIAQDAALREVLTG